MLAPTDTDSEPFTLHSATIVDEDASPHQWMVILHGIYGRGANWRAFARAMATRRPNWGFVLVDLRMHGLSQGAPGPHTLQACAQDVLRLIDEREERGDKVQAVLGHSFGGKVALEMLRERPGLGDVWAIDSGPGRHPQAMQDKTHSVVRVLRLLRGLPERFESRAAFVTEVIASGFARPLADWLAMNLELDGAEYRLTLDVDAMGELLESYFRADLWPVLETSRRPVRFAIATNSSAISDDEAARLGELEREGHVVATRVEGSHWLHVDAFSALVDLVVASLPAD